MSDTPRTDAMLDAITADRDDDGAFVDAIEHARTLERELAEALRLLRTAEGELTRVNAASMAQIAYAELRLGEAMSEPKLCDNCANAPKTAYPTPKEKIDPDCVCWGNWRAIVKEYEPLIGREFLEERTGIVWRFFGLVHGNDDYYYGMYHSTGPGAGKLCLATCVGSLDGNGFKLVGEARQVGEELKR